MIGNIGLDVNFASGFRFTADAVRRKGIRMSYAEFPCALCQADTRGLLCLGCRRDLPRLIPACVRCGMPSTGSTCVACVVNPPLWQYLVAPFLFAYPIDKIIHEFKYLDAVFWGAFLAREMAHRGLALTVPLPEVLIPVPVHPKRLVERGYNQALELARGIGSELNIPVSPGIVVRAEPRIPQVGLSSRQRRKNIRGVFTLTRKTIFARRVAIVDDILTTGATATELARILRRTGVEEIQVWVAARTPDRRHAN